jgi:hypothetical protein
MIYEGRMFISYEVLIVLHSLVKRRLKGSTTSLLGKELRSSSSRAVVYVEIPNSSPTKAALKSCFSHPAHVRLSHLIIMTQLGGPKVSENKVLSRIFDSKETGRV